MNEIYALSGFAITATAIENGRQIIEMAPTQGEANCPRCQQKSGRIHSYYERTPQDLPLCERNVRLSLQVRRFRCENQDCTQSTFAEQIPGSLAKHARKTTRLQKSLAAIALEAGGEAGAKLAQTLHIETSPDTLIRIIRKHPGEVLGTPRVLGIDDFAIRRGATYGTILIDLEKRKPVDLLPDRKSSSLTKWLKDHPGIEMITRDRSTAYARGVSEASQDIQQIIDRWHLLKNLREAVERLLNRFRDRLKKLPAVDPLVASDSTVLAGRLRLPSSTEQALRAAKRQRRYELYLEIHKLHQEHLNIKAIAQKVSVSRTTVYKFLAAPSFPEQATRNLSPRILDPYLSHLRKRFFEEGCENSRQLYREIQAQGYSGSDQQVYRWVRRQRTTPVETGQELPPLDHSTLFSPKQLAWLMVNNMQDLDEVEQVMLQQIRQDPDFEKAYGLVQRFQKMVRDHRAAELGPWIEECLQCSMSDLVNFATGLQREQAAIFNAIHETWSNGQTEGQVTRLKLIKRKMYGRANFDLLRHRVLFSSSP